MLSIVLQLDEKTFQTVILDQASSRGLVGDSFG